MTRTADAAPIHVLRKISVLCDDVDVRTIAKRIRGEPVRGAISERIDRAIAIYLASRPKPFNVEKSA
ncbi:MAG TPA: hypothetical protein VKP30_30605 [Polyangiaceae bacterium]|nr:hypothetical protein [Polyangiaceae bacterium]